MLILLLRKNFVSNSAIPLFPVVRRVRLPIRNVNKRMFAVRRAIPEDMSRIWRLGARSRKVRPSIRHLDSWSESTLILLTL